MTIYYDPKKRKPKIWLPIAFVLIPVFIFCIVFFFGKVKSEQKQVQEVQQQEEDIFNRF